MNTKSYPSPADIRVGVIGYGGAFNMGREHLREMKQVGMTPAAVAELDPARIEIAKMDFPGIATFATVEAMLAEGDVDLIAIITPHNSHYPLALQCLNAGRHVVCEKPLAITTAECDAMIAAADRNGLMLSTYHNRHWDGCILRAVEQIREKRVIGDVYKIRACKAVFERPGDWWRSSRSISGGILYDWGVHLLEYALQLIDGNITEVSGFARNGHWASSTKWAADTNEDEAFAIVRFDSQAWLTLNISQLDGNASDTFLEITGTEGTYSMMWNRYALLRTTDQRQITETGKHYASQSVRYYENIAAHLTTGAPLIITPEWSRRPIHILELAQKSASIGRALPAQYP